MISIVIPLYNKAHTIVHTLNSVFRQTYQDFEVVIVDDGSTDGGADVVRQHFADDRIRIFRQENQGVSVARNNGIEYARAEYVALLDGDDEWHPEYLQITAKYIQDNPRCGLFRGAFMAEGKTSREYFIAKGYENYAGEINLFHNVALFGETSATILKKSVFNKTHKFIPGMKFSEDWLLMQAMALKAPVFYCGIPLNKYIRDVSGQATGSYDLHVRESSDLAYYNRSIEDSMASCPGGNKDANVYVRRMFRCDINNWLLHKRQEYACRFIQKLNPEARNVLTRPYERFLVRHCPKLAVLYIYWTKFLWRLKGYPNWGQKCDLNKIDPKYLNW